MKILISIIFSLTANAELTDTDANFGLTGNLAIYSECPVLASIRIQESNSDKDSDQSFKFKFILLESVAGQLPQSVNTASTFSVGS